MPFIKDHILVLNKRPNNRVYQGARTTRNNRRQPQWTLHRAGCFYIQRAVTTYPAPVNHYPNTVGCTVCQPDIKTDTKGN